jgi:hypothetical protein
MKLEDELRQLFGATRDAPWPGEQQAFDRFLRRRARRGRAVAAAAGLALVAVLGAAVLVGRLLPQDRETVAPAGGWCACRRRGSSCRSRPAGRSSAS